MCTCYQKNTNVTSSIKSWNDDLQHVRNKLNKQKNVALLIICCRVRMQEYYQVPWSCKV